MESQNSSEDSYHSKNVRRMMKELVDHLRDDIGKIDDQQLKAIFETSAEVLTGLQKAIRDYEQKREEAWQD
jgi:hypothetical protein